MRTRNVATRMVIVVMAAALLALALPALAGDLIGWKTMFELSCSTGTVEVGGNDFAYGYSRFPVVGPVNMDIADGNSSRIHYGAMTTFVEALMIEPQETAPETFVLSWTTFNWDKPWGYRQGNLPEQFDVTGILDWGESCSVYDLTRPGSITLTSGSDRQITIYANPVPEPGSISALGFGLMALLAMATRYKYKY